MKKSAIPIEEVKRRLFSVHGNSITIIEDSYKGTSNKALFNHIEKGIWETTVGAVLKGHSHPKIRYPKSTRIPLFKIKERIFEAHGNTIFLVESTYKGIANPAKFIHIEKGEWEDLPQNVIKGSTHPKALPRNVIPLSEIKKRLFNVHGDSITLIDESYRGIRHKALLYTRDWA